MIQVSTMFRIVLALGTFFLCSNLYAKSSECSQLDTHYNWDVFQSELEKLPTWKGFLISKLLRSEIEQGAEIHLMSRGRLRLNPVQELKKRKYSELTPYLIDASADVMASFGIIAKSHGFKEGQKNLVLASKLMAANGISKFYSNAIFLLSFGLGGEILDAFGLSYGDPLVDETDISPLAANEVIVIFKTSELAFTSHQGGAASIVADGMIKELVKEGRGKILAIDLSGMSNDLERQRVAVSKFSEGLGGRKIRKLIVSSHGEPGFIFVSANSSQGSKIPLAQFGWVLEPLKSHFASKAQIFFSSCNLAGTEYGVASIQRFGNIVLPKGGSVVTNRIYGIAGISHTSSIPNISTVSPDDFYNVLNLASPLLNAGAKASLLTGYYLLEPPQSHKFPNGGYLQYRYTVE